MSALFAYGTLMCEEIMAEVSGSAPASAPASLRGYRRLRVRGEPYPALVADPNGVVEGVLYRNVSGASWKRLDRFEGELYTRETVQVDQGNGEVLEAATYVARPEFRHLLEEVDWDLGEFLSEGKERFQCHYKGYGEL